MAYDFKSSLRRAYSIRVLSRSGLSGLGLVTFTTPRPTNQGAFTGSEFSGYASRYKALTSEVEGILGVAGGLQGGSPKVDELQRILNSTRQALEDAVAAINIHWEWDTPTGRSSERESLLQAAYLHYVDSLQLLVNRAKPLLLEIEAASRGKSLTADEINQRAFQSDQLPLSKPPKDTGRNQSALTDTPSASGTPEWLTPTNVAIGIGGLAVLGFLGARLFKKKSAVSSPSSEKR